MITRPASGVLLLAAMFAGAAGAQPFADNTTVTITPMPGKAGNVYVLERTGADKTGDGVYRLRHSSGNYLNVTKADEGQMVGWTTEKKKGSEWILHKNSSNSASTGWSIIAKANGANTLARGKTSSGLVLQRNEAYPDQLWEIKSK
jgi:hypothetical protein